MDIKKIIKSFYLLPLALVLLLPANVGSVEKDLFTVPVVSVSLSVNEMTREELFSVFTLTTTRWQDGQKIVVVIYNPDNPTQKTFLREYFGINTYRFQEILETKMNTGRVEKPIVVETETEMIREISRKPGRIGFAKTYVLIGDRGGIKQVKIN